MTLNISHELFGLWAVHSGLVLVKTLLMSPWTAKRRFATMTFSNPEDIKGITVLLHKYYSICRNLGSGRGRPFYF